MNLKQTFWKQTKYFTSKKNLFQLLYTQPLTLFVGTSEMK